MGPSRSSGEFIGQNGAAAAELDMTYSVSVVDLQSGKWYVKGISGDHVGIEVTSTELQVQWTTGVNASSGAGQESEVFQERTDV